MMPIYDQIGQGYNQTRTADPFLRDRLFTLLSPKTGKTYLDIGCGTGNYTAALYEKGTSLYGIDTSEEMLSKARRQHPSMRWQQGSAESIPFEDGHFDGAIASLTLHHWTDLEAGMKEVYRVVKQGRWVIFTAFPKQMQNYWLNAYFPQMIEDSIAVMPSQARVEAALKAAGWRNLVLEPYSIKPDLQDLFLYSGKYAPERYSDPNFRQGISSFRLQANAQEVQQGLKQLEADIQSGRWKEVVKQFDDAGGDYVFVVVEK